MKKNKVMVKLICSFIAALSTAMACKTCSSTCAMMSKEQFEKYKAQQATNSNSNVENTKDKLDKNQKEELASLINQFVNPKPSDKNLIEKFSSLIEQLTNSKNSLHKNKAEELKKCEITFLQALNSNDKNLKIPTLKLENSEELSKIINLIEKLKNFLKGNYNELFDNSNINKTLNNITLFQENLLNTMNFKIFNSDNFIETLGQTNFDQLKKVVAKFHKNLNEFAENIQKIPDKTSSETAENINKIKQNFIKENTDSKRASFLEICVSEIKDAIKKDDEKNLNSINDLTKTQTKQNTVNTFKLYEIYEELFKIVALIEKTNKLFTSFYNECRNKSEIDLKQTVTNLKKQAEQIQSKIKKALESSIFKENNPLLVKIFGQTDALELKNTLNNLDKELDMFCKNKPDEIIEEIKKKNSNENYINNIENNLKELIENENTAVDKKTQIKQNILYRSNACAQITNNIDLIKKVRTFIKNFYFKNTWYTSQELEEALKQATQFQASFEESLNSSLFKENDLKKRAFDQKQQNEILKLKETLTHLSNEINEITDMLKKITPIKPVDDKKYANFQRDLNFMNYFVETSDPESKETKEIKAYMDIINRADNFFKDFLQKPQEPKNKQDKMSNVDYLYKAVKQYNDLLKEFKNLGDVKKDVKANDVNKINDVKKDVKANDVNKINDIKKDVKANDVNKINDVKEDVKTSDVNKINDIKKDVKANDVNKINDVKKDVKANDVNKINDIKEDVKASDVKESNVEENSNSYRNQKRKKHKNKKRKKK